MRNTAIALITCLGGLSACSGRYEVGSDHAAGGSSGAAVGTNKNGAGATSTGTGASDPGVGASDPGVGASSTAGGAVAVGGTTTTVGSEPGGPTELPQCGLAQEQWPGGEVADPEVIWQRLSPWIWGEQHAAPGKLDGPPVVVWGNAETALDQAIAETGGIPGAQLFVERWTAVKQPADAFIGRWPVLLGLKVPATQVLLGIDLDQTRVSVFTEPNFLRSFPTISRRGTIMVQALFGTAVPPEPPGTPLFDPPAGSTRRNGLQQAVANPACAACHQFFDPLGYSLENYDEAGDYVTQDAGKPVDASGTIEYAGTTGLSEPIAFNNIVDLGPKLANECAVSFGLADEFLRLAVAEMGVADPASVITDQDRLVMRSTFLYTPARSYRDLVMAFAHTRLAVAP